MPKPLDLGLPAEVTITNKLYTIVPILLLQLSYNSLGELGKSDFSNLQRSHLGIFHT